MAKKEEGNNYPERNLAAIIVLAAVLFATAVFTKNNLPGRTIQETTGMQAVDIAGSSAEICTSLPFITYALLLVLLIVLITYLLRRHVVGHVLHTNWAYALYSMLILTALMTLFEYLVCETVMYPAIFAIAAVIAVFVLDTLLSMMHKKTTKIPQKQPRETARQHATPAVQKQKPSIFEKLRKIALSKPAQPGEQEIAELKKVINELKQLKKK